MTEARSKVENNFVEAREFLSAPRDEIQFASRTFVTSESKEVHPEPNVAAFIRHGRFTTATFKSHRLVCRE